MTKLFAYKGRATACLMLFCIFLTSGCKKDLLLPHSSGVKKSLFIDEARKYFDANLRNSNNLKKLTLTSVSGNDFSPEEMIKYKQPLWDYAYNQVLSDGQAIKVPINFGNVYVEVNKTTKSMLPLASLNYLYMYKDSLQSIHAEWVMLKPDSAWLFGNRDFYSGGISIRDWNGNSLRHYTYINGRVNSNTNAIKKQQLNSLGKVQDIEINGDIVPVQPYCLIIETGRCFKTGVCGVRCDMCFEWCAQLICAWVPPDCTNCDPPTSPTGGGGSGSGGTTGSGPGLPGSSTPNPGVYPPNCNPDPNYVVPNYPAPPGMQWMMPCGAIPVPIPTVPPVIPVPPPVISVKNQIQNKPFALYDILCETIRNWLTTARFTPDNTIIGKLNTVVVKATTSLGTGAPGFTSADIAHVQKLDDAFSSVVNMDYFPVTVSQLPVVNGQRLTPSQFLQYIRLNINNFINDSKTFIPYNYNGIDDRAKWASTDPKGALVAIDLAGPDNATVITSYAAADKWTFTTIYDPAYAGEHPVSGNRNFGYTANTDGSYTFYTRGVDRLTSWDGTGTETLSGFFARLINPNNYGIPFTMADNLWISFQNGITNFVKNNGGNAKVDPKQILRPNWALVKEVMDGKQPLSTLSKDCPN